MISVPCGTDDIAAGVISASQVVYASRMKERIAYHAATAVYHIASAIYHWQSCEFVV